MSECTQCGCDREYAEKLCTGLQDSLRGLEAERDTLREEVRDLRSTVDRLKSRLQECLHTLRNVL